jgi:hypothetical protein
MSTKTDTRFNPPPNWPLPKGFVPPAGWQPDPAWGPAPQGWPLWLTVEKKSHVVRNIALGVTALALCGVAACVAIVVGGINDAVDDAGQQRANEEASAAASCAGKTYPDQQPNNDVCAGADGTVRLHGVSVTASPLSRDGAGNLCSQVAYVNNSGRTVGFNMLDWRVQSPAGEVQDNVFAGSGDLGSGELINGGTKSGTMCFDPVQGSGQFVTIYQPPVFSQMRGIWLSNVD